MQRPMAALVFTSTIAAAAPPCTAQQVISGRLYRHEVIGATGLGDLTSLVSAGPSINDKGAVAFGGKVSGNISNAVMVSDLGSTSHRTIVTGTLFSFNGGLQLNDNGHVIALDASNSVDPQGFRQNYLRDWNVTAPPYTNVLVAGASNVVANDFAQIRFEAGLNNTGQTVYSVLRRLTATTTTNALVTGVRPAFNRVDLPIPCSRPSPIPGRSPCAPATTAVAHPHRHRCRWPPCVRGVAAAVNRHMLAAAGTLDLERTGAEATAKLDPAARLAPAHGAYAH